LTASLFLGFAGRDGILYMPFCLSNAAGLSLFATVKGFGSRIEAVVFAFDRDLLPLVGTSRIIDV
jgi:hypothetical protein